MLMRIDINSNKFTVDAPLFALSVTGASLDFIAFSVRSDSLVLFINEKTEIALGHWFFEYIKLNDASGHWWRIFRKWITHTLLRKRHDIKPGMLRYSRPKQDAFRRIISNFSLNAQP